DDPELAWALISQCVGAVVVGRMLASETVQSELLQASRSLVTKVLA
ncbi:MAG: TetR/AcrR family transcriptional regulator, partial [Rubrivivax sp.]